MERRLFEKFSDLSSRIKVLRDESRREARKSFPFVRSRGLVISSYDARHDQCDPFPAAEADLWDGTKRGLESIILRCREIPECVGLDILGGWDGADYFEGFNDSNYEPWASEWDIKIWERDREQEKDQAAQAV